jgi:4'-phosphopantetheinyl transferase
MHQEPPAPPREVPGLATLDWRSSATAPHLDPGGLHLWRIRTDSAGGELGACLDLLGERQRERALGMTWAQTRERYLRSQAGLKCVLSAYLGQPPRSIGLRKGPAGKPYLVAAGPGIELNLTNSGDLALVAISLGPEVGVDCERIRPRRDLDGVARRMFGPEQVRSLAAAPEPARLARFYLAWTALEADAKCDGRGLFRPRPSGATPPQVAHCCPEPGYVAALARAWLPPLAEWQALDLPPIR